HSSTHLVHLALLLLPPRPPPRPPLFPYTTLFRSHSMQHSIATIPCWPSYLLYPLDLVFTPSLRGEALQLPEHPAECLPEGFIGGHTVVLVDRVSDPG